MEVITVGPFYLPIFLPPVGPICVPITRRGRQDGRHTRRVGRGRLGRVPRVHPQPSLQVLNMFFQRFEALFQLRVFGLQLLDIGVLIHTRVIGHGHAFP